MMETVNSGWADIHSRPFPDRLKALKNIYVFSGIWLLFWSIFSHGFIKFYHFKPKKQAYFVGKIANKKAPIRSLVEYVFRNSGNVPVNTIEIQD